MIQKTGGQPQHKTAEELDINNLGTYINFVVIAAMRILLSGGLEILKKHCEVHDGD